MTSRRDKGPTTEGRTARREIPVWYLMSCCLVVVAYLAVALYHILDLPT